MPMSPQWSPSLRFPHQDPIHPPLLTHTCPARLILLDFITRTILGEEYRSCLWKFVELQVLCLSEHMKNGTSFTFFCFGGFSLLFQLCRRSFIVRPLSMYEINFYMKARRSWISYLTFRWLCIVIYSYNKTNYNIYNQLDATMTVY